MFYGFKDNSYDPDEDTNFIPRLVDKALLPKLTGYHALFCQYFYIGEMHVRLQYVASVGSG